ncbi:uncharacterized protein SPSC_03604 [Sporisorium scitamineum]|uniref:Mig1 protein n=1 Tax=Sporisorium scitamineum TaxID=49012 RepID=A0A0F7S6W8_9BASI|nr:uncharacterized protein SPSC_03604 [Sporisorium scitamineum]CDW95576.1 hypothetical protein [Sporisorium scitamineum]
MKVTSALITLAVALCSTSSVAAEWLKSTPEKNYATYCEPGGSEYNNVHGCFVADPAYIKELDARSSSSFRSYLGSVLRGFANQETFRGYLSDDQKKFVLLEEPKLRLMPSMLLTKKYRVSVKSWRVVSPTDTPGEKCVFVKISTWDDPAKVRLENNFCGLEPVTLPDYLWK